MVTQSTGGVGRPISAGVGGSNLVTPVHAGRADALYVPHRHKQCKGYAVIFSDAVRRWQNRHTMLDPVLTTFVPTWYSRTMLLSDWLENQKQSPEWLAERLGIGRPAVTRYLNGSRRPEWDVIARIIEVTGGAVTANDFVKLKRRKVRIRKSVQEARAA